MDTRVKTVGAARLFWSLLLGLGLTVVLLWALMPQQAVEAQGVNSKFVMDTTGAAVAVARISTDASPASAPSPAPAALSNGSGGAASPSPGGATFLAPASNVVGSGSRDSVLLTPPLPGSVDLAVCMTTDRVWGIVGAGETATVTVGSAQMGVALADGNGFFWTTLYDGNGDQPDLSGGESVAIYSDGTVEASLTLRSISGEIDVLSDVVSGTIGNTSSPISVTVYTGGGEPSMTSYSQTVSTDGSGNFSADFTGGWDFYADETAVVAYVQNDVEVHRRVYAQRLVIQPSPVNNIIGWTTPGVVVTATVYSDATTIRWQKSDTTDADTGRYWMSPSSDIEEGDIVVVKVTGGPVLSRTVDHLTPPSVDASNDRVTGQAEPGDTIRGRTSDLTPLGWRGVQTTTTADATGVYTLEFGAVADIMPGQWAGVYITDVEGDDLNLWAPSFSVDVNQTWNEVSGRGPSPPADLSQGWPVTLTLYSAVSDTTFVYSRGMEWWGWYSFGEKEDGLPDIAPGDVVTVESDGYAWQGVVKVMTITVQHDVAADRFTGTVVTPTNRVELWGAQWEDFQQVKQLYPVGGQFNTLVTANSPFTATPAGFDVRNAVGYEVAHRTSDEYTDRAYREVDSVRVWPDYNGASALLSPPGTPYTITLRDSGGGFKAQLTGTSSDPIGEAGWNDFWNENEQIETGDQLQAQSAAGFSQTVHIPAMTLQFDEANNRVSGTAPANSLLYVSVDNQGEGFVPTDDSGQFAVAVDQLQQVNGDGDLVWGDGAMICYINEDANQVCRNFDWPQIVARYEMNGRNTVFGDSAIPGNTIYITVTDELSQVVDSGTTSAGACDWCGANEYSLDFPDGVIVPSNTVTVNWGDGYVDSTEVVTITANPVVGTPIVTGTAPANGTLNANRDCSGGGCWTDLNDVQVDATGVYTLDFGSDSQYGDSFNVHYNANHGHQTQYSFWIPAPELEIQKETVNGHAIPGGRVMYHIQYCNNGNGDAENTIITDTLPTSTTYAANSGGFPAVTDGNIVTFSLGTVTPKLNPWDGEDFYVSLIVDSGVLTQTNLGNNCVWISTSSPGDADLGNNQACSGGAWVEDGQWGLWVEKRPEPNDPHPGQTFQYVINYGTDGGAANGPAWLTDTLPTDTEVVSWYTEDGWGGLWTEVITTGGQFVLYAPAGVPGDMGGRIYLTLLLDGGVSIGTRLENTVVITTSGDIDPGNNEGFDNSAQASGPRYDMRVDKHFNNGQLIPGGEIYYSIEYRNEGNSAVHVWVTDTLPAGTSFESAWTQGWDSQPLVPSVFTGDYVVWDMGVVEVNDNSGFNVQLNISNTVTPGTVLTNCATVGITQTEDTPLDNESCIATTVYTAGMPNLYVIKELRDDYNPGHGSINYRIYFGNYGDQTIYDVYLTDTLPISTTYGGHNVDWHNSQYTDTTPSGELRVLFERIEPGQSGQIELSVNPDDPNARMLWYTNAVEIDTPSNDANSADNSDATATFSGGEVDQVDLDVDGTHIWGQSPDGPITITTPYTWTVFPGGGGFDWYAPDTIQPGDRITVAAGSGTLPVVIDVPTPFTAHASSITDTVWGQIDALDHEQVTVDPDNVSNKDVQTDGSGNYSAIFSDVPRGGQGEVRYNTEFNYADVCFHRSFLSPDLLITVDYRDNWVEGNYEAGHTVWLTATESDRTTVKGTAVLTTGLVPWWGGRTGFSTNWQGWTSQPDIQPGDWVFGLVNSASYTTSVQVGAINAEVNVSADTVSGTLDASWLGSPVTVRCEIHEENGPDGIDVYNVDPNGGAFFCNFGGAWDIVPGTNVAVSYTEPDGDVVQTHPSNPAPHLQIQKQANGNPAEGGNFSFQIQYWNNGGLAAENTVITDTLLGGMTYLTDTSGFPHTGSGSGPIVWDLGTLPANSSGQFYVFVEITASEGERITNTVQIATSNPYDQGEPHEKESEWSGDVQGNDTHLNVGKNAWTHDPAPGYDFVYSVNVCNNGSTGSSQVTLTDTLHLSTTLQSWWDQDSGWTEVLSSSHQLVVSRPSLNSGECSEVYLRVHLTNTAWSGMSISNTVVISAANDMEANDNESTWWGNVNDPHTNLYINKNWNRGQLVPGGDIHYNIDYGNNGNTPVASTIRITDTLPVSATFNSAWRNDQSGQHPVTPTQVTAAYVVWEISGLDNGYGDNFEVVLDVDSNAIPGAVLTNSVEISPQPNEDSYDDNTSAWVETLYDHGPNLRLRKDGGWNDESENTRQAWYNITVENIGDVVVQPVVITDTYDSKMYLDGGVGVSYWRWWDWHDYSASGYFTVTLESLYPGERMDINFSTITDTAPLPFGLVFTNTAEVTLDPGDINSADNSDDAILTTGPDLYVEKRLVAGDLLPGEIITFSLRFGNAQEGTGWWNMQGNAWLTDTLPAGLEFITATLQSCGWCPFTPDFEDGTHYAWNVGSMWTGYRDEIYLTVRITDTATGLDTFTNYVEITSTELVSDTEPYRSNNVDSYDVDVALPHFEVGKVYESSRVAGMPVTYTLTVTNTGHAAGSGVTLSDTVSSLLSNAGGDGTLTGSDMLWDFGSIAVPNGAATGWFSATLPCAESLVILNNAYLVVTSTEGVVSSMGAPVSFIVLAPTLSPTFTQSAANVDIAETVYFTASSTTNGTGVVAWAWNFGDGEAGSGSTASHAYDDSGDYTVTLTITDTCGFSASQPVIGAVTIGQNRIFLPLVMRNYQ